MKILNNFTLGALLAVMPLFAFGSTSTVVCDVKSCKGETPIQYLKNEPDIMCEGVKGTRYTFKFTDTQSPIPHLDAKIVHINIHDNEPDQEKVWTDMYYTLGRTGSDANLFEEKAVTKVYIPNIKKGAKSEATMLMNSGLAIHYEIIKMDCQAE